MTALGLGYAFAGGACHLYAVARLRSSLLSPLGTFAACAHAIAPPFMLSTAALCFLDRSPTWVKDLGIAVPATGLWRPRAQPAEAEAVGVVERRRPVRRRAGQRGRGRSGGHTAAPDRDVVAV